MNPLAEYTDDELAVELIARHDATLLLTEKDLTDDDLEFDMTHQGGSSRVLGMIELARARIMTAQRRLWEEHGCD